MDSSEHPFHCAETAAVLYLAAPLFIFFAFFVRLGIAIPACFLIAFLIYELARNTAWRDCLKHRGESLYFLLLASIWIGLSGGIGPIHQNGDWFKHYMVVNVLAQHPWPAAAELEVFGHSTLRYYIGWYLVPSLFLKIGAVTLQTWALSAWSVLGVFLFFNLLPGLIGRRPAMLAAPLAFVLFGGADIIGTRLTNLYIDVPYHFEWWAGWIQYSSNTTALFWVPQHAIPAWLGAAMLMRYRQRKQFLPYCALLTSAILLWSPFSAIGMLPFLMVLLFQGGFRPMVLNWRPVASVLLLAAPVAVYLTAGSGTIPHGYIGTIPCIDGLGCATVPSYFIFLLIEIGAVLAILFMSNEREQGFLAAAAIALFLIPLYKIGSANDFAMRVSLPSLAVLGIMCAKLLATESKPYRIAAIAILLTSLPTVLGEFSRGFLSLPDPHPELTKDAQTADTFALTEEHRGWVEQYFASQPIWVLR